MSSSLRAGSTSDASRRALPHMRKLWPCMRLDGERDILERGEFRAQRRHLERAGDALSRTLRGRECGHVFAVHQYPTCGRQELPGKLRHQRGLACTVRADDGVQLVAKDRHRQIVGRRQRTEALH